MEQSLSELWERFRQGLLNRRDFVRQVMVLTGGTVAATGLVPALTPTAQAKEGDIVTKEGTYDSMGEKIAYYLAHPKKGGPFPAMLVIHENTGLTEFIRDVARHFAYAGYLALAPHVLSGDEPHPNGKHLQWMLDTMETGVAMVGPPEIQRLMDGYNFLANDPRVLPEYIASVGFCWGGARSFTLATVNPDLWAAIVFYGSSPPVESMAGIKAPVLGLYGALDNLNATSITGRAAETARQMSAAGKVFEWEVYNQARHGFFRDGTQVATTRAAGLAWELLHDFLNRHI